MPPSLRPSFSYLPALFALAGAALPAAAQTAAAVATTSASTSFCLFEAVPQADRRLFINLGIVQYIEMRSDELRIYYGGGNLGSGHEFRLPVRSPEEAADYLRRMQATAAACAAK